jgi:hypothetical protein
MMQVTNERAVEYEGPVILRQTAAIVIICQAQHT